MQRLDKILANANIGSRSDVKLLVKKGRVAVNGEVILKSEYKVSVEDKICVDGQAISTEKYVYYMLNKPTGYVSATIDNTAQTVISLLEKEGRNDLFCVGRLDKDTEGLLLITNNGEWSHRLLSPKYHVEKTYLVHLKNPISEGNIKVLEEGVDIGEKNITKMAKVEVIEEVKILLTITEGKFHQVKRMLQAVDNEVIYLKRVSFGGIKLDEGLNLGEYRRLTQEEVNALT